MYSGIVTFAMSAHTTLPVLGCCPDKCLRATSSS